MIALFTTKTTHHIFFENQIYKNNKKIITVYETKEIKPKFSTHISFEKKRDKHERKAFFKSKKMNFKSRTFKVSNINKNKVLEILKQNYVKYILVFGTRKIKNNIAKKYENKIFNLHGGNPEEFRGLDSHYWSLYHNNFNLFSCLHKLNNKLDDGDIIFLKKLNIKKNTKIHQIRSINTYSCISMALKLINLIKNKRKIPSRKQKIVGRYYSFMPSVLKKIIEKKFTNRKNEKIF